MQAFSSQATSAPSKDRLVSLSKLPQLSIGKAEAWRASAFSDISDERVGPSEGAKKRRGAGAKSRGEGRREREGAEMEDKREIEALLEQMHLKEKEEAMQKKHSFWESQPVKQFSEEQNSETVEEGPVQVNQVRQSRSRAALNRTLPSHMGHYLRSKQTDNSRHEMLWRRFLVPRSSFFFLFGGSATSRSGRKGCKGDWLCAPWWL